MWGSLHFEKKIFLFINQQAFDRLWLECLLHQKSLLDKTAGLPTARLATACLMRKSTSLLLLSKGSLFQLNWNFLSAFNKSLNASQIHIYLHLQIIFWYRPHAYPPITQAHIFPMSFLSKAARDIWNAQG